MSEVLFMADMPNTLVYWDEYEIWCKANKVRPDLGDYLVWLEDTKDISMEEDCHE